MNYDFLGPHGEFIRWCVLTIRNGFTGGAESQRKASAVLDEIDAQAREFRATTSLTVPAPIPMRLTCEKCGQLHIDEGEFATKPHHTHSCQHCGLTWRPAVVHTVGVQFLPGFKNEPPTPTQFCIGDTVVTKTGITGKVVRLTDHGSVIVSDGHFEHGVPSDWLTRIESAVTPESP